MVFSIAKETGWDEDTILDMPIGKAWAYKHAVLRSYDANCHYKTDEDERKDMYELFTSLAKG
jgi:hypothetical protein